MRERAVTALAWLPAKFCSGNLATSLPLPISAQREAALASDGFPLAQLSQQTNSRVRSRRAQPASHDHSAIVCSALLLLPASCSLLLPPSLPPSYPPPWLCLSLLAYLPLLESLHVCQYLSTSHPLPVCSSLHIFLSLTGLDTWGGTIRLANNICSKLLTCHCRKSSGQTFDWIWWSFMVLIQILTKANFKVHTNIKSKNKH